jgi:hypothetical protein
MPRKKRKDMIKKRRKGRIRREEWWKKIQWYLG